MTQQKPITELPAPYLVYLGDAVDEDYAKTGFGLADWAGDKALGQCRSSTDTVDIGLTDMTFSEAVVNGAKSLIIGVAGVGGKIPESWNAPLLEAVESGLNIISGAHEKLSQIPGLADAAKAAGVALIEIRMPPASISVGTGKKRSGRRLLTVGTDCALGKKYTALTIAKEMRARGMDADFRATGQTGIMIAGSGIPIDCVVTDFISGAAEMLTPDAEATHWDIIEGQGALLHPGYAAVTLGLLHGSQPDEIVLCHDPRRIVNCDYPYIKIPPLNEVIDMYLTMGRLTNPDICCRAISLNTKGMDASEREEVLARIQAETGRLTFDPVETGPGALIDLLET